MGMVFVICGKTGSGKSTLAKFMENKYDAVNFSADSFMIRLFGEIKEREVFESKLSICKHLIYDMSDQILKHTNVVFDFGFWTKEERNSIIERFQKHKVIMIYTKLDDEAILERLKNRNRSLGENEYYIDDKTFEILSSNFEEPDETENMIVYTGNKQLQRKIKAFIKEDNIIS